MPRQYWCIRVCFNPHPPRRAGATDVGPTPLLSLAVSILTRPEGRALPRVWRKVRSCRMFQSSPAPKGGRYDGRFRIGQLQGVSILTRPEGRALRRDRLFTAPSWGFNPHPPRRAGATWIGPQRWQRHKFQSSPAPKGGRYTEKQKPLARVLVSILTRPEGRALPQLTEFGQLRISFNPHPPRRAGATVP